MTNMSTTQLLRQLQKLKRSVLEDGKIDWDETEQLREAVRPLAVKRGFLFEDYERLLEKCREDGKITPDESRRLALQLDFLCSAITNRRLKFWLAVLLVTLLTVSFLTVFRGIVSSTDTSAFHGPTAEETPGTGTFPCVFSVELRSQKMSSIHHSLCGMSSSSSQL